MAELDGVRRRERTDESVVKVWAANYRSGSNFYLEPGERLQIFDDEANVIEVTPLDD